jgi:hypothetical protein
MGLSVPPCVAKRTGDLATFDGCLSGYKLRKSLECFVLFANPFLNKKNRAVVVGWPRGYVRCPEQHRGRQKAQAIVSGESRAEVRTFVSTMHPPKLLGDFLNEATLIGEGFQWSLLQVSVPADGPA